MKNLLLRLHAVHIHIFPESGAQTSVRALLRHPRAGRQGGVHLHDGLARIRHSQRLGHILDRPVRRSGLLAVDGKAQLAAVHSPLDIDGGLVVIHKFKIFISTRDGRVRRRIHIGHRHGVVLPLGHLQLGQEHRIVERGTDLAGPAADGIHGASVLVGTRRRIAVGHGKGGHPHIGGELLPRHQHGAVDFLRTRL